MEESSLFKNMRLVTTQQILLPIISMKMSQIISESKTVHLISVTSIYLIIIWDIFIEIIGNRICCVATSLLGHHEKSDMKTSKVLQQQCHMYGID